MSAPVAKSERTWDEELRQAERLVLGRLSQLVEVEDPKPALRACAVLAQFTGRARRDEAERRKVEPKGPAPEVRAPQPEARRASELRPGLVAEIERRAARPTPPPFTAVPPACGPLVTARRWRPTPPGPPP